MRKLRTIKQAAKLRQYTSVCPTPKHALVVDLFDAIALFPSLQADDDDLEDFIPSRSAHRSLRQLFEGLRDVASISKKLQTDGLSMLDARDLLDGMLEAF
ncbi:hypothetical protein PI124_g2369 [Phytophthora idaei]|nr:hypothetical protein PI124_g2369 [Phytophthora idaei]